MKGKPHTEKRGLELFVNEKFTRDQSGSTIVMLETCHSDNPFWIGGDRHLCGKCRNNTHVKKTDAKCQSCGVKFRWI